MSDEVPTVNLRKLKYSPTENPFFEDITIETKHKTVRASRGEKLVNMDTGEIASMSVIHTIEEKDDEGFVKVFTAGTAASFSLSRSAQRVFQAILVEYQNEKMTGGYADAITLYWFGEGLNGNSIGMAEKTFQRGLKELLAKQFLKPKTPNVYWVNPALFFKGNRVAFLKEYRRKTQPKSLSQEATKNISK